MLFHKKTAWLVLSIFLVTFSTGGIAESQAPLKDPKAAKNNKKKWAEIKGFRSAKFGMKEKQVLRAIAQDFKISKSKVKRLPHSKEKTTTLEITIPELFPFGGPARIGYILGFKSKRLIHVNIVWGRGVAKKVDAQSVVDAARFLRTHLLKKRYKKEKFAANNRINDAMTIFLRGLDKMNRIVLLVLTAPKANKDEDAEKAKQKYMLKLSYILKPYAPDIFQSKEK